MQRPIQIGLGLLGLALAVSQPFVVCLSGSVKDAGDEILAKVELEHSRRHELMPQYTGDRQYTLQNQRFGKEAAASVVMNYRQGEGEHYVVLKRSGSEKLGGIIDKVIASESNASLPAERTRHQIAPANYRARLVGTEITAGKTCIVLQLSPRIKAPYLITGKAWIDSDSYAVVRIEGQFAASLSALIGAPRITEEFVEVRGFWLPARVHSGHFEFPLRPHGTEYSLLELPVRAQLP